MIETQSDIAEQIRDALKDTTPIDSVRLEFFKRYGAPIEGRLLSMSHALIKFKETESKDPYDLVPYNIISDIYVNGDKKYTRTEL